MFDGRSLSPRALLGSLLPLLLATAVVAVMAAGCGNSQAPTPTPPDASGGVQDPASPTSSGPQGVPHLRLTTGDFEPYFSSTMPHSGVALRITREAFALEGITVEFVFRPWKRAYEEAKAGEADGTALWGRNPEREEHFLFSDPVVMTSWRFFHRKDMEFDWEQLADLAPYRIGATREYTYGESFYAAVDAGELRVEWVPRDELNYRKLLQGRIDLFPQDVDVAFHEMGKIFTDAEIEQVAYHEKPLHTIGNHLLLPKERADGRQLIEAFNRGLEELRVSGKLDEYLTEARGERRE